MPKARKGIKTAAGQSPVCRSRWLLRTPELTCGTNATAVKHFRQPEFKQNIRSAVSDKQPVRWENTRPLWWVNNRPQICHDTYKHARNARRGESIWFSLEETNLLLFLPQLPSQAVPLSTKADFPSADLTRPDEETQIYQQDQIYLCSEYWPKRKQWYLMSL